MPCDSNGKTASRTCDFSCLVGPARRRCFACGPLVPAAGPSMEETLIKAATQEVEFCMHVGFWDGARRWSSVWHVMAMGPALTGFYFTSLCLCLHNISSFLVTGLAFMM